MTFAKEKKRKRNEHQMQREKEKEEETLTASYPNNGIEPKSSSSFLCSSRIPNNESNTGQRN
jgi:hypothetical protein